MDTATETFYCTEFVSWPVPEIGNDRYKGKPTPLCWQEFGSIEARNEHLLSAHAEQMRSMSPSFRSAALNEGGAFVPREVVMAPAGPEAGRFIDDEPGEYHAPTGRKVETAASPEQLDFIVRLGVQKGQETNEVTTKAAASIEIERLMAFPDKGLKANRFPGSCTECNGRVAAEAGFVRKLDGKWLTAHKPGECPEAVVRPEIPQGCYAITAEAGHTSFYKITPGRKPGVVFVDMLVGGGAGGSFDKQKVPYSNVDSILAKIAVDIDGASKRFFDEAAACRRCGRGLSKEKSRKDGYGSECAKYA